MRRPSITATASILAFSLGLSIADDLQAQRRRRMDPPDLKHFISEEESFESEALDGEQARYRFFLPKGYDDKENAEKRYPLVIYLHGMWEDHNRFYGRGGAKVLDTMAEAGEIPEMILICADGSKRSFYIDAANDGPAYETLIAKDLVKHCEETYRVLPGRDTRAIAGVSMGGYGALKIALRHPDTFGTVAAHSAALLPVDFNDLDEAFPWLKRFGGGKAAMAPIFGKEPDPKKWREENLLVMAETIEPDDLNGLRILFDCGDEDRYGFFTPNQNLHAALDKRKVKHTWQAVKGGNHGWGSGYNQGQLPDSLRFIAAGFAARKATSGLGGMLKPKADEAAGSGDKEPTSRPKKRQWQ